MALARKEKAILDLFVEGQGMRNILDALAELCEKYVEDDVLMLWRKEDHCTVGANDLKIIIKNLRADMF